VVARRKLTELHETMGKLVPQIRHWLRTGFVAPGKIISLNIPQLYSIVRGKVGKAVEFGLSWGLHDCAAVSFLPPWPATRPNSRTPPMPWGGRGSHRAIRKGAARLRLRSWWVQPQNVERLGKLGVRNIGWPRDAALEVQGSERRLIRERALVEVPSAPSSATNTDSTARLLAQPR